MTKINKDSWEIKQFEKIVMKLPKAKQVKTDAYNSGSKYPIISQEETYISGYCDDDSMLFRIDRPVVVFGDHTRVLKYVDFDFVVGADGVKIIMPIEKLDTKFLYYYLKWYNVPSLGYSRHYKLLKEIQIPLPPLSIQQRIVDELDEINAIISAKKQQLKELDELAQSIFYNMFGDPVNNEKGWEVKKLGEICQTTSGGTPSSKNSAYYDGGTIPWLRSGEVGQGYITETGMFITEEGLANSSAKYVPVDSVAIAMYGATVGQVGIIKKEMTTNQAVCSIFPCEVLAPVFLMFFLKSMKPHYLQVAAGGAQPNISQGIIKATYIPLPPLPLQETFAARVSAIEEEKAAITASIDEMQTLLDARMQEYFG